MNGTLNAHRVFRGTAVRKAFLQALEVDATRRTQLQAARDLVRQQLRTDMPKLQNSLVARGLIEDRYAASAASLPVLSPRFRMQGSAVYFTLNDPAQKPQEIDYDDGLYIPTSFVNGNGSVAPVLAAKAFFRAVEVILEPLCAQRGWTLDRTKPHCIRVRIVDDAHIDLPLYAIPDAEFTTLAKAARAGLMANDRSATQDDMTLLEDVYRQLPADRVMLARRNAGWIESDPRKIEDWFKEAIDEHGEGLRFVCRYLKAWRDHQWPKCSMSSLAIMASVVTAYDELHGTLPENRDDLALLNITGKLPTLFSMPIKNPVIDGQVLDDNWTADVRATFVQRAKDLHEQIDAALSGTYNKALAIAELRKAFGERIPADPDLLNIDNAERSVTAYKPAKIAAPFVPRTTSG